MDTEQPHTAFGECPVTTATFSKQGEMTHVRYKATRVRSWSDSNYNYTVTSHYAVIRGGNIGFERVPVDGSTKMADNLMESIEPFDFSDEVDFQTAYLAGYLADKYDVDEQQSIDRANQRIKQSAADAFSGTVRHAGATTIHITAEKKGDSVSVKITNDGRSPETEVVPKGGLHNLYRHIIDFGGTMEIQSKPSFALTVVLPVI